MSLDYMYFGGDLPAPFATPYMVVWSRGQKNEQQNNAPSLKNNAAAGYKGPVKIDVLKGAGLLIFVMVVCFYDVLLGGGGGEGWCTLDSARTTN